MKSLDDVTREFVGLFEQLGIPYAVMGGIAVHIYALPRPTFDADFTISLARDSLPGLLAAADKIGYSIPAAQAAGWIDSVRGLPVIKFQWFVGEHPIDVDVFLAETAFQHQVLQRRQRHTTEAWAAWFVTAEDLILLKLLAGRPKDRVDVGDVLLVQGTLDEAYMRHWAQRLGIAADLERALNEELE